MASLRREVLGGYRRLMRVRLVVFKDDTAMVEAAKTQLRIEFTKNKDVTDPSKIGQWSASLTISSLLVHLSAAGAVGSAAALGARSM